MVPTRLLRTAALAVAAALAAVPAQAITIDLNDIGGVVGSPAEASFRAAAHYWESVLTNNATVTIDIGFQDLGEDILGSTGSAIYVRPIDTVYTALAAGQTSALDATAVTHFAPRTVGANGVGAVTMVTPGYVDGLKESGVNTNYLVYDNDGSVNNQVVGVTGANLKALGLSGASGSDAEIQFSSRYAGDFDFDPTDGIADGKYDFTGTAVHEIGHALGFVSGADDYDYVGCPSGPLCEDYKDYDVNGDYWGYTLDLFRYSQQGLLNWAPGEDAYFSVDGGASQVLGASGFSTGEFLAKGDGWQASHWLSPGDCVGAVLGVMNPYICGGVVDEVTALDLAAMDAIGWDVDVDVLANPNYAFSTAQMFTPTAVPEPASWALLIAGVGALGAQARRRRGAKPASARA